MFLLFASKSDVEQIGLELSLESVQSSLVSVEQQVVDVVVDKVGLGLDRIHIATTSTHANICRCSSAASGLCLNRHVRRLRVIKWKSKQTMFYQ